MNIYPLQIGAVLFSGFELLDIFGPLELFGLLGEKVSIRMLAESAGEVRSYQGPRAVADTPFVEARNLDVLLIPGGLGTRKETQNQTFLEQLKSLSSSARYVGTICTGSALLARTGLLDGKSATSNKLAFDWVKTQGPQVNWVRQARWVEDGKYFTSSGVSAGMDMALGLIQRLFDRKTSLEIATMAEYQWHEDKERDPFA